MLVDRKDNISIITQQNESVNALIAHIEASYNSHKNNHIVVLLSAIENIEVALVLEFLQLSNTHRSNDKSFVIVGNGLDVDEIPEALCIVPSIQEAYDIIEMENMERDLGL